jgi:hypothetical protein
MISFPYRTLILSPALAATLLTGCRSTTVVYEGDDSDFAYRSGVPYSTVYGPLVIRSGSYYYSRGGRYYRYDRHHRSSYHGSNRGHDHGRDNDRDRDHDRNRDGDHRGYQNSTRRSTQTYSTQRANSPSYAPQHVQRTAVPQRGSASVQQAHARQIQQGRPSAQRPPVHRAPERTPSKKADVQGRD